MHTKRHLFATTLEMTALDFNHHFCRQKIRFWAIVWRCFHDLVFSHCS